MESEQATSSSQKLLLWKPHLSSMPRKILAEEVTLTAPKNHLRLV